MSELRLPALALLLSCLTTAFAQVDAERVVATVNGEPITGRIYYARMEVLPGVGQIGPGNSFVPIVPGYLTLQRIIDEMLLVQLAEERGVAPTEAEIDAEIELRMEEDPDVIAQLLALGFTEADYRYNVILQLSQFKIESQGITITDFQVEKQYEGNRLNYTLPKRYHLRLLRVDSEDAKPAADAALAEGKSFEDVATEFSSDISRFQGGDIGQIAERDMQPVVRDALLETLEGGVTKWLNQGGVWLRFKIEEILPAETLELDERLRRRIREQMMLESGRAKNNILLLMREIRKKAVLDFKGHPFADELTEHFKIGG
ncbi:MAG: peptidyl-prolyl cis-trans isomerase [Armatimonadetes bacterium]|nr:peptidyl-prolyl cis-trans isomerase [Armatimonadota bacterium]